MSKLTWKESKFLDEYMKDYNGAGAARRAGYSEDTARQIAYEILTKPYIKEELKRRFEAGRMSTEEIVARIEGMVEGRIPTKVVKAPSHVYGKDPVIAREEYDTQGAVRDLGKVYALFVDKQIVENIGLEIVDDEESDSQDPPATS